MKRRFEEVSDKLQRVRDLLDTRPAGALLLRHRANFAWITGGGRGHVNQAGEASVGAALITPDRAWVLSNNIESARLAEEEYDNTPFEPAAFDWHAGDLNALAADLAGGPFESDLDGASEFNIALLALRAALNPFERDRYRDTARRAAALLEQAARRVTPGQSENDVAADILATYRRSGYRVPVCLVAADERIERYRHPLPTDHRVRRRAMLVAVSEHGGLHTAVTRFTAFEPESHEMTERHRAVCAVHAAAVDGTRPGRAMGEVLQDIFQAYADHGHGDQWRHHHQGGPTGYQPRDAIVRPDTAAAVTAHQAFAWNPTITGTKCEDTFLASPEGPESLAGPGEDWPALEIKTTLRKHRCADILIQD